MQKNIKQYKIWKVQRAKAGKFIRFYKTGLDDGCGGVSVKLEEIDTEKYRQILWNCFEKILKELGYDLTSTELQLFGVDTSLNHCFTSNS
ncbi:MAG: hypothetical protein WA667_06925 [Candidatus Nitrosopolaris sp.]